MAFSTKTSQILIGIGTAGLYFGSFLPQTLGLEQYRQYLVATRNNEEERVVSADCKRIVHQVIDKIGWTTQQEALIDIFQCSGWSPLSRGSILVKTGGILGIPMTYEAKTREDIMKEAPMFRGQYLDFKTNIEKQLAEALVLSKKAQTFGIARELMYLDTYHQSFDACWRAASLLFCYSGAFAVNRSLLRNATRTPRYIAYCLIAVVSFGMYISVADSYYCARDNNVDKRTASLDRYYAEGGIEFYEKQLELHKSIRAILGPEGAKYFTITGNEVTKIHDPHVRITTRLDNVKRCLEKFDKTEAEVPKIN